MAQKANGPLKADGTVDKLIELEERHHLDKPDTLVEFGHRIDKVGSELKSLVRSIKAKGKSLAGFGAATKSTTLLSHFGLGREELDFIADDNPLKQGLFSPSAHIPVVGPAEIYRRRPDYLLILAWNFAQPIMAKHAVATISTHT